MKSMRNRVSLWHLTGTISPSTSASIYTHYLATGAKGANHDPVVGFFVDELPSLQGPDARVFYSAQTRQAIRLHLVPLMGLCDQIEKRACLYLRAGNSRMHPIMGMSADLVQLGHIFRACAICRSRNRINLEHDKLTFQQSYNESWSPPTISNLAEDQGCPNCVN
jgi:hypothetical protein